MQIMKKSQSFGDYEIYKFLLFNYCLTLLSELYYL